MAAERLEAVVIARVPGEARELLFPREVRGIKGSGACLSLREDIADLRLRERAGRLVVVIAELADGWHEGFASTLGESGESGEFGIWERLLAKSGLPTCGARPRPGRRRDQ